MESAPPSDGAVIGSCKGRLDLSDRRIRFRADYVLHAPDRLYMEVSGAVGSVRAILAVDGDRLTVLLPHERQFLREPATRETFDRLLGFSIEAADLQDLLAFRAPEGPLAGGGGLNVSRSDADLIVEPASSPAGRFVRLELRSGSLEAVPDSSLRAGQFDPSVPDGWERLFLDRAGDGSPLLMP